MATYVEADGGELIRIADWRGPLRDDTPLVAKMNPVTTAWARNVLPAGANYADPVYRTPVLDHLATIAGSSFSASLAAEADRFQPQM